MPGVARGDMNGYRDFEQGHLRTSSYANGYDPYRRDKEDFSYNDSPLLRKTAGSVMTSDYHRHGHGRMDHHPPTSRSDIMSARSHRDGNRRPNGVDDLEQNSFEFGMRDGSEPTFEVDHLATYTSKSGTTHPEDGLTKLKQMESTTGIWTMRCTMTIERRYIIIVDKGSGDELERFPLPQVHEPTAVLKNDRRETYNNLVLFTVIDDPKRRNSPSDMHIFQSVNAPAHDIVDEILAAKGEAGGRRGPYDRQIPPPPMVPVSEPHGRFMGASRVGDNFRASYIHRDDMDTGQNEMLERDVQLLNNCFDDIEKFVSRLQAAAEAYKELERRKMERGGKRKNKSAGEGMLNMRARPPPAEDFVDIFQKFKFAFNLLAKLKAHIHDPNAPELVHFLFTPLSLIFEASRDPIHGGKDLGSEAVAPLLLPEAKQLLVNCLTSKELELWQRLGRPWTLVKDEYHGYVPPYNPRFYNGWQPSPQMVDEVNNGERFSQTERYREDALRATSGGGGGGYRDDALRATSAVGGGAAYVPYVIEDRFSRREDPYRRDDFRTTERRDDYRSTERRDRDDYRTTERRDDYRPSTPPSRSQEYVDRYSDRNKRTNPPREALPPAPKGKADLNQDYAQELKRMGATIYEAVHERTGKNQKELTVEKGDILQVLDKSRNWWKLRNHQGETGYAPYTILAEYQASDGPGQGRLSGDYSSYINGNAPPPPAPPLMAGSSRAGSRADDRSQDSHSRQRNPPDVPKRPDNRNRHKDDMHLELQTRLNTSDDKYYSSSPRSPGPSPRSQQQQFPPQNRAGRQGPTNLSQDSTVYDVQDWLEAKGFSRRCMDLLNGYNGQQVFSLDRMELERLLGHDEGRHLDSLLIVQKNNSGYRTRGTSELRAILQQRKTHVETQNQRDNNTGIGTKPIFTPDTPPDYSDSDVSSDDFGNAGKTLRNLLERQRKKIQSGYYKERSKNY